MKVFKWVLIVFGGLALVFVVWVSTVETAKLTAADFEAGGTYPAEERQALFNACNGSWVNKSFDETICTCIADKAESEYSRFARLLSVMVLEGSPAKFVALVKGIIFSGVAPEKITAARLRARQQMKAVMSWCRFETQ